MTKQSPETDRCRGALLGLAVGDALGTTLEFSTPAHVPHFPALAEGPHREVTGGGPFGLAPGQVTDDTQMACCLAASVQERHAFDAADVAQRYVEWMGVAFDVGNLTRASLGDIRAGAAHDAAGRRAWERSGRNTAGNGSLMRTAPIGVFFRDAGELRRQAALAESAITHFDPRCRLACAAFDTALATGIQAPESDGATAMIAAAGAELDRSHALLRAAHPDLAEVLEAARDALRSDLDAALQMDPHLEAPGLSVTGVAAGFVRVAFRLAFWELRHVPSFEAALIDVVNRGGDADTNGAIAGALLGALHGEEAIPPRWRDTVMKAQPLHDAGRPLDHLHPRQLLRLAG